MSFLTAIFCFIKEKKQRERKRKRKNKKKNMHNKSRQSKASRQKRDSGWGGQWRLERSKQRELRSYQIGELIERTCKQMSGPGAVWCFRRCFRRCFGRCFRRRLPLALLPCFMCLDSLAPSASPFYLQSKQWRKKWNYLSLYFHALFLYIGSRSSHILLQIKIIYNLSGERAL